MIFQLLGYEKKYSMKLNKLISYLFHPILSPIIATLVYLIILPRHTSQQLNIAIITMVFIGTYLLPIFFMIFLKKSNAIETFHLENVIERKMPVLLMVMVAYLLATIIKNASSAMELALFFYGMTVGLIIAYLLIYKKFKISLHMLGIGGLLGFFIFVSYHYKLNLILLISFLFIIAGFIAISRIKLKAHTLKEVYLGFVVGLGSEIIVYVLYII